MTTFQIVEAAFAVFGAWLVGLFLLAFILTAARAYHAEGRRFQPPRDIPPCPQDTSNNVLPVQLATARQRTARRTRDAHHHS